MLDDEPDGCWSAVFIGDVSHSAEAILNTPQGCKEAGASAVSSGRLAAAVITQVEAAKSAWVELYDSGATCHLSPYCDDFTMYCTLKPPLFLKAANGQQFPAMGIGTIVVSMPNVSSQSDLTLEGVLYAPSVRYTLVSLGTLDAIGYHINISGGHLEITLPKGERLAHITHDPQPVLCVT
jgi:hypothetical protein